MGSAGEVRAWLGECKVKVGQLKGECCEDELGPVILPNSSSF